LRDPTESALVDSVRGLDRVDDLLVLARSAGLRCRADQERGTAARSRPASTCLP